MVADKHSVVLHFDEDGDKLMVFSVPSQRAIELRDGSGFEISLTEFRALDHDEAERRVGAGLLQLVESLAGRKLGLRDYDAEFEQHLEQWIAEAEPKAASGDPEAQHELAFLYEDLAYRRKSRELLARAKKLLESAASAGFEKAARDLEHWEAFERRLERRINEK